VQEIRTKDDALMLKVTAKLYDGAQWLIDEDWQKQRKL